MGETVKMRKKWKEDYNHRRLRIIEAKLIEFREERAQIKAAIKLKEKQ